MATLPALIDHVHLAELKFGAPPCSRAPLLMQRLSAWYTAKIHAHQDAQIITFLEERGGQFNDEIEREISRRFGGIAG